MMNEVMCVRIEWNETAVVSIAGQQQHTTIEQHDCCRSVHDTGSDYKESRECKVEM